MGHQASQQATIARGAVDRVGPILDRMQARSVFLVADEVAYAACGAERRLAPALSGRAITCFTSFQTDPQWDDVQKGIQLFGARSFDAVLALGGGSAIDMAKLIGNLSGQPDPLDLVRGRASWQAGGPPLLALPTTAGTGSEATHFAVCYLEGKKYSVAHRDLLPAFALIDPDLTATAPARVAAASGLDCLCQAIESWWSVAADSRSIEFAHQALGLAAANLVEAVTMPAAERREAMCRAAHFAGRAINLTKTTAPHAISYAITTNFGIPHGMAVALTLPALLRFNGGVDTDDCADPRGPAAVQSRIAAILACLGCDSPQAASQWLERTVRAVGGPVRLSEAGIRNGADLDMLVEHVNTERLDNNPRRLTPSSLRELLQGILE